MKELIDKWTELRETIEELHENNLDKADVENVTRFLLKLMDVLDKESCTVNLNELAKDLRRFRNVYGGQGIRCCDCPWKMKDPEDPQRLVCGYKSGGCILFVAEKIIEDFSKNNNDEKEMLKEKAKE